jgi:hypothetical protein
VRAFHCSTFLESSAEAAAIATGNMVLVIGRFIGTDVADTVGLDDRPDKLLVMAGRGGEGGRGPGELLMIGGIGVGCTDGPMVGAAKGGGNGVGGGGVGMADCWFASVLMGQSKS